MHFSIELHKSFSTDRYLTKRFRARGKKIYLQLFGKHLFRLMNSLAACVLQCNGKIVRSFLALLSFQKCLKTTTIATTQTMTQHITPTYSVPSRSLFKRARLPPLWFTRFCFRIRTDYCNYERWNNQFLCKNTTTQILEKANDRFIVMRNKVSQGSSTFSYSRPKLKFVGSCRSALYLTWKVLVFLYSFSVATWFNVLNQRRYDRNKVFLLARFHWAATLSAVVTQTRSQKWSRNFFEQHKWSWY